RVATHVARRLADKLFGQNPPSAAAFVAGFGTALAAKMFFYMKEGYDLRHQLCPGRGHVSNEIFIPECNFIDILAALCELIVNSCREGGVHLYFSFISPEVFGRLRSQTNVFRRHRSESRALGPRSPGSSDLGDLVERARVTPGYTNLFQWAQNNAFYSLII